VEGESTILLGKVWRMRKSETMRAASRLLLSHPIFCLLAVLAAVVVLGVLGPLKVVHATDVAPVEAENFDNKPTGTSVVTNTTLYQNGKALRFNNNTAIAWEDVDFTSSTSSHDVVLVARAGQSGGSPKLRVGVNGTFTAPAQAITNNGAPQPYTFDVNAPSGSVVRISVKASNTDTGRQPFLDYVTFPASGGAPSAAKPNFVFILTDDMRYDDLEYMPKTSSLLGSQGMTFTRAFVPTALCCPSRATIMRGQYTHNTGVWLNPNSPSGGWEGYKSRGYEQNNIATHLNDPNGAGYRTGLFGKYFNTYDGTTVPPGWDDWFGFIGQGEFFNYNVNDNGTMRNFGTGEGAYSTDVLSAQTQEFIDASVDAGKPFFAYVAPKAPHGPLVAAPRHEHAYDGAQAPRPPTSPAFNEEDVSDKPPWIKSLPRLTPTQIANIDTKHEGRVESLQAVDDLVKAVVDKLHSRGALGNTYVVFTSDNGYHLGEHRIPGEKLQPYEESIHVPLLVRGPGVRLGSTTDKLVLNTDFLPTFTDLAGITTPPYVDGRSLRPVLTERATSWRTAILLESRKRSRSADPGVKDVPYDGIRTTTSKYVEYEGGDRELYTLSTDPYEESSTPTSSSAPSLQTRLQALKGCAADSCRAAENGP
jgi:N-acetylglucosamine-6-sulfatase